MIVQKNIKKTYFLLYLSTITYIQDQFILNNKSQNSYLLFIRIELLKCYKINTKELSSLKEWQIKKRSHLHFNSYYEQVFYNKLLMRSANYLCDESATNHKDYNICKSFLDLWLNDKFLSLNETCYYLDNYKYFETKFGHCIAHPSYCFKFMLNNRKTKSILNTEDYCYHGTSVMLVNKIVKEGLCSPNGLDIKRRNGSYKGKAVYTTKIPQHAQVFADPYQWKGKYFQIFFLVRQDISKISWTGRVDKGSQYAEQLYYKKELCQMRSIHKLHSHFLTDLEVQWGTQDENSLMIEAVIVKVHDKHPMQGEFQKIAKMIQEIN